MDKFDDDFPAPEIDGHLTVLIGDFGHRRVKVTVILTAAVMAGLLVILTLVFLLAGRSAAKTTINPLCTTAAVNALSNYWNAEISSASYTALQNTEANAVVAMAARLNYCKAHA